MKQTAVEFLEKSLKNFSHIKHSISFKELINQAKEMEINQLEQFYNHGMWAIIEHGHGDEFIKYYNETFKSE